ncbi:MAG: DMT family transporter [Gemmatimonadota bacterium]|nr:DMT family transporter [Gemmatimonadota bacterium]
MSPPDRPGEGGPPGDVPSPAIPPRWALVGGVFAITWAAILVRWADAPSIAIAFWRMGLAVAILLGLSAALRVPFWRSWRGIDWWTGAGASLLLALHFAFWIASLEYTTVAASVVLVSTQPVFVALLGWAFLKERPLPSAWIGIVLAFVGSAVVAGADFAVGSRALFGDLLALLGAVWISFYYVLARYLRATKDLLPYVTVIYGGTAAWLLIGGLAAGVPLTGFDVPTWAALALLAIGPTILGHSSMNYALRYLRAYQVNVAILGEPIGAALWAGLLLAETPGWGTWVGGSLILIGIWLTLRRRTVRDEVAAANL